MQKHMKNLDGEMPERPFRAEIANDLAKLRVSIELNYPNEPDSEVVRSIDPRVWLWLWHITKPH